MPGAGHDGSEDGRRAGREWRVRVQAAGADLGTTLVEALSWVGDRLAYYADRVADEAYLGGERSWGSASPTSDRTGDRRRRWRHPMAAGARFRGVRVSGPGLRGSSGRSRCDRCRVRRRGARCSTGTRQLHRRAVPPGGSVLVRSPAAGPGGPGRRCRGDTARHRVWDLPGDGHRERRPTGEAPSAGSGSSHHR